MKIMRLVSFIAIAILCFILYAVFRTGIFGNKKVDTNTALSKDSFIQTPMAQPSNAILADTLSELATKPTTSLAVQSEMSKKKPPLPTHNLTEKEKIEAQKKAKATLLASEKAAANNKLTPKAGDTFDESSTVDKKENVEPKFHVIIGSFKQEANAKAQAAIFEQKFNKKANIVKQGGFVRVWADEFEFTQAATLYSKKLKEAGQDNIILKY